MTGTYRLRRVHRERAALEKLTILAVILTAIIGVGLIGEGLYLKSKPAVAQMLSNGAAPAASTYARIDVPTRPGS